jgi:hypothetical protein
MSAASDRPGETEAEAVHRLSGLTPPRDASAIGRRPRTEAVSRARQPLGLGVVDGPDATPEPGAARAQAFRSTLWDGRTEAELAGPHSVRGAFELFDGLAGMVIELNNDAVLHINNIGDREIATQKEIASLKQTVDDLRVAVARLEGAQAERTAPRILRP